MLYTAFFGIGMGPVPWCVNSEIYPIAVRGAGNGAATATNWLTNLFVSLSFLTLAKAVSLAGVFWIYSCVALVTLVFVIFMCVLHSLQLKTCL
ncbi:hypothetical protein Pelo_11111 [Pelomyxa schiedti]|nr:hypothetical protein Pelo_11111 [Pelomyxa schiedti]